MAQQFSGDEFVRFVLGYIRRHGDVGDHDRANLLLAQFNEDLGAPRGEVGEATIHPREGGEVITEG